MQSKEKVKKEVILEPYLSEIRELRNQMYFYTFENKKPYSFDYHFKEKFTTIQHAIDKKLLENPSASISPSVTNHIPVFLPSKTHRIAFFSYQSKSVRAIDIDKLETILTKQAEKRSRNGEFPNSDIAQLVKKDLKAFNAYHKEHNFEAYRRDISTSTIQFNAYDEDDNLLIEKSFVRGGLVFDLKPEEFQRKITVTYPRHRKQRSDKKNDYLPLKLLKIRGISPSQKSKV